MAFNFGGTAANKPAFGTPAATSASTLFGGFGTSATTTSAGTMFGGFGAAAPTTSTTGGFGGFGGFGSQTATTAAPSFGFGQPTTTSSAGFSGFSFGGTNTLGAQSTGIGTGTTGFGTTAGTGGFGTGTTGFGTGIGTGTGTGIGTAPGLGLGTTGFGAGLGAGTAGGVGGTTGGLFGAGIGLGQQQQPQANVAQLAAADMANMATAVSLPLIFGDERDTVIARWNQLQAFWGSGKGYYNQQGLAVQFNADNPFCRFKAVGYSCLPSTKNRDGLVGIIFNKKVADVQTNQSQIVLTLHKILGNKPNLTVCVEGVRSLPDDRTEMTIYLQERAATGAMKRHLASEVFNFMNQASMKQQLTSQLSITEAAPKMGLGGEQLKQYLDNPPAGIDPLIWRQAKLDNPDPDKLIPVPMIGFHELHRRLKHQAEQTSRHQARLDVISGDVTKLQQNHTDMQAKIEQYKREHLDLSHRVLKVMVKQEVYRKLGYSIQADEEQLRVQLENIQAELNAPTQFKGRLNELMSQMRMQHQISSGRLDASYQVYPEVQEEIKQHLKQQQEGIQLLMSVIREDLEDLKLIEQGLVDTAPQHR